MAEKQSNKDRLKEITDSIENGIKELFESEKYKNYLRTMSRFHKYSVNNTMLIYMQKPDATLVAGYNKYGFFKEGLVSIELKGKEGQEKIAKCIDELRNSSLPEVNGVKVATKLDYKLSKEENLSAGTESVINLPKSNVLKYILENGSSFVVRPSGTEPKMKIYLAVKGSSLEDADKQLEVFKDKVMNIVNEKLA